jgi:sugar O-acyltransferase (sialic acid O-acetyltransferase NeuD family)
VSVVVYGAGGHGKVVTDALRASGVEVGGFVDDGDPSALGDRAWLLARLEVHEVVVAIGDNRARERVQGELVGAGARIATCAHPRAVVASSARVEAGAQVLALAVVNPDAHLGAGAIINTAAVIEHDCVVGPFAHISPNATLGGAARVGARSHVGLGAIVLPGVTVGDDVVVGAGAVVTRDVPSGQTVVGVPARAR